MNSYVLYHQNHVIYTILCPLSHWVFHLKNYLTSLKMAHIYHFWELYSICCWWLVLVDQSCLTLCGPMECIPPGSSVHGIFRPRILERVAISFSRISSWPRDWTQASSIVGRHFTVWATREVTETWALWIQSSCLFGPLFPYQCLEECLAHSRWSINMGISEQITEWMNTPFSSTKGWPFFQTARKSGFLPP